MTETPEDRLWRLTQRQADQIGKTFTDIAALAEVSDQAVYKWRKGRSMRAKTDRAIAEAFGWEAGARELIRDGKDPVPPPPGGGPSTPTKSSPGDVFDDPREQAIWGLSDVLTEDERLWCIKAIRERDVLLGQVREDPA